MADDKVQIIYEAVVRGMEKVDELARKNEELGRQNDEYQKKLQKFNQEHERSESAMLKARRAILAFRKELFAVGFAVGVVAGALKLLSGGSDALAERLEKSTDVLKRWGKAIGDAIARLGGNTGQLSRGAEARLLGLLGDIQSLTGESEAALRSKLRAEELKLISEVGAEYDRTYKRVFDERRKLLLEAQRMEELGLKRIFEIRRELNRELIRGIQSGVSDPLFKLLQGEQQTFGDVLKGFQSSINRAVANAVGEAVVTTMFSGGGFLENLMGVFKGRNATTVQLEEVNRNLKTSEALERRIADCICYAADNIASMAAKGQSGTFEVTGPEATFAQKAAGVAGLVGAVAGAGAFFSPVPGAGMPIPQPPPDIRMPPGGFPRSHSGGYRRFVGAFASGGEVPIMAQPGEFIVRRSAAAENKDLLKDINSGSKGVRGAQNVFLIKANDAQSFAQMLASPSAQSQIEVQVIRSIMRNGQVRSVMKDFAR